MISFIVASHDPGIRSRNLLATLTLTGSDELILVEDAESIAAAYNDGTRKATQPIRCYVHHDVVILDMAQLRAELVEHCRPDVGLVGAVGSRDAVLPWWDGNGCGSVVDRRIGLIDFSPGGEQCAYLDGLLLATAQDVTWDESYPGWHLYDHDMCQQMLAAGLPNYCLTAGRGLLRHNTTGAGNVTRLPLWAEGVDRFRAKWTTVAA